MHAHHFWWAITSPAFDNSDILFSSNPPFLIVGLDRLMAILFKAKSIREVIAFPKSSQGHDVMCGAPAAITLQELSEYHLKID